jgi:UDP-N-acetylmuramoyl-L-alanyl-D-glutamate--2,6-diaminopimelate ligase
MTLASLIAGLSASDLVVADGSLNAAASTGAVTLIAYDSRAVVPGAVFVALRGQHADGSVFAQQAIARGAMAIVAESAPPAGFDGAWIQVRDARLALALLAAAFYGHPSREMALIGITGTNGKTTTAYLVAAIFEAAGVKSGLLGTVAYRIGDQEIDATRTTPEAPDVQRFLRDMVDRGCGACAMEVSSHALSLRRVQGLRFAAGVFTNLTREHLDFHGDMGAYFAAKRQLFEILPPEAPAIINVDDPRGADLLAVSARPVTYAITRAADVTPGPLSFSLEGLRFDVRTPRGAVAVRARLVGRPNVYNILAAVAAATALDVSFSAIERGVAALDGVPGRFQVVSQPGDDVTAVVDYAHTDDALRNLLETARPLARGRLITVFGCGGDRDRSKRPLMGAVAARLSDVVIVTSDNPRTEDPARIIDEVKRGLPGGERNGQRATGPECLAIVDRRTAIARAIDEAQPGDLVLIAGKGHEKYQVIGDRVLPFDDVAVARDALQRRRSRSRVG